MHERQSANGQRADHGSVPAEAVVDLLQRLPALVLALDPSGTIQFWNEACTRELGFAAAEMVGQAGALERIVPSQADRERMLRWWTGAPSGLTPLEIGLLDSASRVHPVQWHRVTGESPLHALGAVGIGHDLSNQRRIESDLRESREWLRTAFEHLPLDFWVMGGDGRYAMVNPAAASRWGNNLGKSVDEIQVPESVRDLWRATNLRAFNGQTVRGEVEYPTRAGPRAYEYVVAPLRHASGEVSGILGVNIDITERKAAEHARERSEATKSAILDALPDLMFRMSSDGTYIDFHAPAGFALMAAPSEFLGRTAHDVLPPPLAELCVNCIARTLREGGVQRYEYSSGADPARHYEVRMTACAPDEVVVLVRNISDVKTSERNLRESEARYRALFESSPLGVFVIQDGRMAMSNPAGLAILGTGAVQDVFGRDALDFVADRDRDAASGCVVTAMREGRSPPHIESLRRVDGREITVEASGSRIELGGRPAVLVTVQDVSQRLRDQESLREADEQLRQAQKMEAVGQLAAGVAHDFNNLLTAIFGYVSLARSSLDRSSPAWTALDGVQAAAEQASGVIRSLLAVSRKAVTQFKPLDLVRVAAGALELIRSGIPSNISVEFDAPQEPVPVRGDETLLKQVVLNLAINARDAMPAGGTLRVSVFPPTAERGASLRVEDTGEGIPNEILRRIFEPFFTTKHRESSSGLGLSIAEGIVRSHSGTIEVESVPGRGTTFTVWLPAQPARLLDPGAPEVAPGARADRVLVIDPNRQVREIIGSALSRAGFAVAFASTPDEAARSMAVADPPIRLAIVNLDVPEGAESLRRLSGANPALPVLALTASGTAQPEAGTPALVLRKPFQVAQIPELVRRALTDQRPPLSPETPE